MNLDEKQLDEWKRSHERINIPDSIDESIMKGIKKGKKDRNNRMRVKITAWVACFLIVIFAGAVRISPAFASYVDGIPGIRNLVDLIRYDKGLQDAVKNDFIQKVHRSASHDGITFTVEGVIADNSRMILFYHVQSHSSSPLTIQSVQLFDQHGNHLKAALGFNPNLDRNDRSGKLSVSYGQHMMIPSIVNLNIKLNTGQKVWSGKIQIPIDVQRFQEMKQQLPINQTVKMDQQIIHFEKAIIYPTRIGIYIHFDPNNSKRIFGFDQLKLVDAKGEVWSSIRDGISATILNPNERIIYFESSYFREPKKLFLVGNSIRALDQNKLDVVVDLKKQQLLKKPDDKLTLKGISKTDRMITLKFELSTALSKDDHISYDLFASTYQDASGKTYQHIVSSGTSSIPSTEKQTITLTIKNENFQGPLTFHILDYPNRITKPFRIQIK